MANLNIQDLLNKSTKRSFDLDLPVLEAEESIQEAVSSADSLTETLVSNLLQASLVLHICHLRATSFAKYLVLKEGYEICLDFVDKITETVQGRTKTLLNFQPVITIKIADLGKEIEYLDMLLGIIEQSIAQLDQGGDAITSNIVQELGAKLRVIVYKLTFLE